MGVKAVEELGKGLAGKLKCRQCGRSYKITEDQADFYVRKGWPECCGEIMDLATKEKL